jgi:hypothetical protein
VSADPLAVHAPGKADLNLYSYVRASLLKRTDPLGLADDGSQSFCATETCFSEDETISTSVNNAKSQRGGRPSDGELKALDKKTRAIATSSLAGHLPVAQANYQAYLAGKGNPGVVNFKFLQSNGVVVGAQNLNDPRFVSEAVDAAREGQSSVTKTFRAAILNPVLDASRFEAVLSPNLALAAGPSTLDSAASLQISRHENTVTITGTIEHWWHDRYSFDDDRAEPLPGFGDVDNADSRAMEEHGKAKSFDMSVHWSQSVKITVRLDASPAPNGSEGAPAQDPSVSATFGVPKELK